MLVAALYVTANALAGPEDARRFLSGLLVVVAVASAEGGAVLQVAERPPAVDTREAAVLTPEAEAAAPLRRS